MTATTAGAHAGDRLDRLPISPFHWRILVLIGAGLFIDAFDLYIGSSILAAVMREGWSSLDLNALFMSATFIGMATGAFVGGIVGDRFGRKFAYQFNLLLFGFASVAAACAPSMEVLVGLRFVIGVGLGAESVIGYALLAEFVPPQVRGRWGAMLALIVNMGVFVAPAVSFLVVPNFGWRWMFVIAGIGALLVWLARRSMPESPRWLESKGRHGEAAALMAAIEAEVSRTQSVPGTIATAQPAQRHVPWTVLFGRAVLPRTLVSTTIAVSLVIVIYSFVAWMPTFFVKQGLSIAQSLAFTAMMSAGAPLGCVVGIWLADRAARKKTLVAVLLLDALAGLVYLGASSDLVLLGAGLVLMVGLYLVAALGMGCYVPELFPTEYRMRGNGFANTAARVSGVFVPFIVLTLFQAGSAAAVIALCTAVFLVCAFIVALLGPETARKSLEAIERAEAGRGATLADKQVAA
ncbi:MAG TPA: MFS transporter [Ramlibacter sp.]|uniref:MFS transporter n=1 Tax=Ramlibacter sp. TaxID=1917967 RepID=UPI002BA551EB|nr:MFS transporter [Ramlibacter sp.]HVZ45730.1 MFS transporter [Ramlibacter sp.]